MADNMLVIDLAMNVEAVPDVARDHHSTEAQLACNLYILGTHTAYGIYFLVYQTHARCLPQLIKAESGLLISNAQSGAGAKKMSAGYAGQDQMIRRSCVQSAVLQDVHIAVSTLGHTSAGTVEDGFGTTRGCYRGTRSTRILQEPS